MSRTSKIKRTKPLQVFLKLRGLVIGSLLVGLVVLGVSPSVAGVEYLEDELECVKLSGQFMRDMVAGKLQEAFDRVSPYFPISKRNFDNLVDQTEIQLRGTAPNFGTMIGYEFVREERVSEFLVRYTFVIKHELTLTRWIFIYYKPDDRWLLNSLYWDDQVESLFPEVDSE